MPSPVDQLSPATQRVHSAIASASARTGVDFDFLLREASVESGLNPAARARTSSATGLFQFTKQTWLGTLKAHGAEHGLGWAADAISQRADGRYEVADASLRARILDLRYEPEASAAMAAELAAGHEALLEARLGRPAAPVDLYLAHFLGDAGAVRFLEAHEANPDAAAAPLMPAAAAANRNIFYAPDGSARSLAEIRDGFIAKLGNAPAAAPTVMYAATFAPPSRFAPVRATSEDGPADRLPELRSIEPMPQRLSLAFARDAYQRLARMGSAS